MTFPYYPSDEAACFFSALTYADDVPAYIAKYENLQLIFNGQITADDNYAIIVKDDHNRYFLAIRGSTPLTENSTLADIRLWIKEDLDAFLTNIWPYAGNKGSSYITQGSYNAFQQLYGMHNTIAPDVETITDLLRNAAQINANIVITGHSLGGNMANVYASFFKCYLRNSSQNSSNIYLYTFAAPAAGNSIFATDLDNDFPAAYSKHYQNQLDIVPQFPVTDDLVPFASYYVGGPFAGVIFEDFVNLGVIITGIAALFKNYHYAQAKNGIQSKANTINQKYTNNTMSDWIAQITYQHSIATYASLFNLNFVKQLAPYVTKYKAAFGVVALQK